MWSSLQRRFSVSDDTRIHQLHADIASCKQNGEEVETYFGKLKIMWDDLDKGFVMLLWGSRMCSNGQV